MIISLAILFMAGCQGKYGNSNYGSLTASEQNANLTPLEIVNKRMSFYNEHNFDAFIKLYHKDFKVYNYPDKLIGTGADRLVSIFKSDFENKSIKVQVISQISNGRYVINNEIVTHNGKETKYVSIYEVKDGLINNVSFVR